MRPLLQYYGSLLCFLPGGLLALFYGAVARLAGSASLGALLGHFMDAVEWLVGWRLALLVTLLVLAATSGASAILRPWASGVLAVLSLVAVGTVLFVPSGGPGLAEVPFAAGLGLAAVGFGTLVRGAPEPAAD